MWATLNCRGTDEVVNERLKSLVMKGAIKVINSLRRLVGIGSRSHDLFGAACTSFMICSLVSCVNAWKLQKVGTEAKVGGSALSVDDLMRQTLSVKKVDKSCADRVDLTFTFKDDRPDISSIDCHSKRGFVVELILCIQNSTILAERLCWSCLVRMIYN